MTDHNASIMMYSKDMGKPLDMDGVIIIDLEPQFAYLSRDTLVEEQDEKVRPLEPMRRPPQRYSVIQPPPPTQSEVPDGGLRAWLVVLGVRFYLCYRHANMCSSCMV